MCSLVNFCDILLVIKYLMSLWVILLSCTSIQCIYALSLSLNFSGFVNCMCRAFLFTFQSKYCTYLFNKLLLFMKFSLQSTILSAYGSTGPPFHLYGDCVHVIFSSSFSPFPTYFTRGNNFTDKAQLLFLATIFYDRKLKKQQKKTPLNVA